MSNQEIKEALKEIAEAPYGTKQRMDAYDRIRDMAPEWLRSQQTLIDQQAQELAEVKAYFVIKQNQVWALDDERKSLNLSLELAVKALKEIESSQYTLSSKVLIIARTTLDQIRRVET